MTEPPKPKKKQPTSFYLSEEALTLLRELKEETGLSQAGILEVAIRLYAKRSRRKE